MPSVVFPQDERVTKDAGNPSTAVKRCYCDTRMIRG
jgi:hypothetical protein